MLLSSCQFVSMLRSIQSVHMIGHHVNGLMTLKTPMINLVYLRASCPWQAVQEMVFSMSGCSVCACAYMRLQALAAK